MPWQLATNGQTAARLFIQTKQPASIKSNQYDIEEIALSEHKSFQSGKQTQIVVDQITDDAAATIFTFFNFEEKAHKNFGPMMLRKPAGESTE